MMMLMILVSLILLAVVASQAPCSDPVSWCADFLGTAGDFAIITKTGDRFVINKELLSICNNSSAQHFFNM
jgi:hypothetical protein